MTGVNLIYFTEIEKTFENSLYFLPNPQIEMNQICDHKHMKRDQGFQKLMVICIEF